ncbi:MAG: alpha/beta hydrolase [Candidatus Promineifilaceae bacterium]
MARLFKYLLFPCLLIVLAACSSETPPTEITDPGETTTAATAVQIPSPTDMPPDPPTRTPVPAKPVTLEALTGNWLGAIYLDEKPLTFILNITVEEGTALARPRLVGFSTSINGSQAALSVVEADNTFYFDSELGREGSYRFTGQLLETSVEGTVVGEGKEGNFYLIPLVEHDDLVSFTGLYRFEDGRTLDVSLAPTGFGSPGLFLPGLWLLNAATGGYQALSAVSEDTFYAGPSLGIALPATDIITFQANDTGQIDRLTIQSLSRNRAVETAVRLKFPTEDVTFVNEGVTLAGTVTLPPEAEFEKPFPAIVLVHGSGRATRNELERFIRLFASEGFAVLAYDKRGVGESGGSYSDTASTSRLLLLAGDAAAGVAYMRGRPDIKPDKVGLLGGSQAGWVNPAAAVQSGHVAFIVNLSGPVVTVGQEGVYSTFTGDGAVITLTKSEEEIAQAVEAAAGTGFDPAPYITELELPGLWLFGAKDASIPVAQSVENLQAIIDTDGKSNFSYVVFPNGNHGLWESETGSMADWPYIRELVPGYYDIMLDWLRSQK